MRSWFDFVGLLGFTAAAWAGSVDFTPVGPTTVPPGTDVVFDVSVSAESLDGIATADLVIGSNNSADVGFVYDPAWLAAFVNVTPATPDVGFYDQDVFVGGNNGAGANSVGMSLVIGRVFVSTLGLDEGVYRVRVDSTVDNGTSSLTFGGQQEPVAGSGLFAVRCLAGDGNCDGRVNLLDFERLAGCFSGPQEAVTQPCDEADATGDGDVDLEDFAVMSRQFTVSP